VTEAVIVEALRTPIARGKPGKGDLSGFHPANLLAKIQFGLVEKAGIDPRDVARSVRRPSTRSVVRDNRPTAWSRP